MNKKMSKKVSLYLKTVHQKKGVARIDKVVTSVYNVQQLGYYVTVQYTTHTLHPLHNFQFKI